MRLVPHPVLSALIAGVWPLLQGSLAPATLITGLLAAVLLPLALPLPPSLTRLRRPDLWAAYLGLLLLDILRSALEVAQIIALRPRATLCPGFVRVPLALTRPEAIALLAASITLTPGTLTAEVAADRKSLLVHCLDAPDPDATARQIKARYERRIARLFR